MVDTTELIKRIEKIEIRNLLVEANKAWETSITRRVVLMALTYLAVGLYMRAININQPWLNAIIPSIGFMLSTLTLPFFKSIWLRFFYREKRS